MSATAMPQFHPDQFLLNDYAAGSTPGALALPVAVHLEYCPQCRAEARQLDRLGAQLFEELDPVPVADDALEALMKRLDNPLPVQAVRAVSDGLPRVLRSLVPDGLDTLDWKRTGPLRATRLRFGDATREVALHHIRAGGRVPEHGHAGSEITVVLEGRFSDADGVYEKGDFIVRGPDDVHRPTADAHRDCLCLAVLDAPIRFRGLLGRVINPFMRIHPR